MLQATASTDHAPYQGRLRHPLWMLVGVVVGVAASIGGLAVADWLSAGAGSPLMLFFPLFAAALSAMIFRRSMPTFHPVWPLIGFPIIIAGGIFLSGLLPPLVPAASRTLVTVLLLAFVLGSLAYGRSAQKQPVTPELVRLRLHHAVATVAGLLVGCIAVTLAAYLAPLPTLQAVLPKAAASAFGAWLAMSLIALAWVLTDRLSPASETPESR